jgi:DNA replication and repair protein RecF
MFLQQLHLQAFRNYRDQRIDFTTAKTILLGENAQGKSNLLEAVELFATLRSHRTQRDRDLVLAGSAQARLRAQVERSSGPVELVMQLQPSGGRRLQLNGESLRRHLDALGTLNAVQFSSLDLDLVRGAPGQRRDWLDRLVTQLEPYYAHLQQQYQQVLRQRNTLLRRSPARPEPSPAELAIWDAQLVSLGIRVIRRRARALERLVPFATQWHQEISGHREVLTLDYQPNIASEAPASWDDAEALQAAFFDKLAQRRQAEQMQGTSLVGPHRDDLELSINRTSARHYGSQGQQRTLVLALKLAELQLIDEVVGEPPLLLLDDVLAELDLRRQQQLLEVIQDRFQTLITTTHLATFAAPWQEQAQILTVEAGVLSETKLTAD